MEQGNFAANRSRSRVVLSAGFFLLAMGALMAHAETLQGDVHHPTLMKANGSPAIEADCRHHPV